MAARCLSTLDDTCRPGKVRFFVHCTNRWTNSDPPPTMGHANFPRDGQS